MMLHADPPSKADDLRYSSLARLEMPKARPGFRSAHLDLCGLKKE